MVGISMAQWHQIKTYLIEVYQLLQEGRQYNTISA